MKVHTKNLWNEYQIWFHSRSVNWIPQILGWKTLQGNDILIRTYLSHETVYKSFSIKCLSPRVKVSQYVTMVCLTGVNPSETPYTRDCSHRAKQFELKLCILFCLIGLTLGFSGISRYPTLHIFVCLFVVLLFLYGNLFGFENIFGRQSKVVYLFIRTRVKSPDVEQICVVSFLITRSTLSCSTSLYTVHRTTRIHVCIYCIPDLSNVRLLHSTISVK